VAPIRLANSRFGLTGDCGPRLGNRVSRARGLPVSWPVGTYRHTWPFSPSPASRRQLSRPARHEPVEAVARVAVERPRLDGIGPHAGPEYG
jgi:hypothetical protein